MSYILKKENISSFLRTLQKSFAVIAPVKSAHGDINFALITSPEEVCLNYGQPNLSIKGQLLPQDEALFVFDSTAPNAVKGAAPVKPKIFWGIRPCDLKSIELNDRFFADFNYPDMYYLNKRQDTLTVVFACTEPESHCFCHATQSGPAAKAGYDLQLTELKQGYYVQVGSEAGQKLVDDLNYYFAAAASADDDEVYHVRTAAETKMGPKLDFAASYQAVKAASHEFWEEIGDLCLRCGGCSFTCPTCTCYNIVDRVDATSDAGERARTWDSCVFDGFSRMAGRHNYAHSQGDLVKKRFMHKLVHYIDRYNTLGCVGCGRCSVTCLGGINMEKVVGKLAARGENHD